MAYVDLNPVRAAMATTPENSDHTSIQTRVQHWQEQTSRSDSSDNLDSVINSYQPVKLHPFIGNLQLDTPKGILFNLIDYVQLLDWTGRQIRQDKTGVISSNTSPVLNRLSISPEHWVYLCTHFESHFKGLVGSVHSLKQACKTFNRQRTPNLSSSADVFP